MKSGANGGRCANIKMRGKKEMLLSCGCCVAVNFKDMIRVKEAQKEIKDFSTIEKAVLQ